MVHVWTSENSWIPWPFSGSYYYGYRWLLLTHTGTDSRCTHHVAVTLLPSFPVDAKAPETTGPWLALRWATRKLEVPQDHGINLPQWKGRGRDYTWCSFSPWWLAAQVWWHFRRELCYIGNLFACRGGQLHRASLCWHTLFSCIPHCSCSNCTFQWSRTESRTK